MPACSRFLTTVLFRSHPVAATCTLSSGVPSSHTPSTRCHGMELSLKALAECFAEAAWASYADPGEFPRLNVDCPYKCKPWGDRPIGSEVTSEALDHRFGLLLFFKPRSAPRRPTAPAAVANRPPPPRERSRELNEVQSAQIIRAQRAVRPPFSAELSERTADRGGFVTQRPSIARGTRRAYLWAANSFYCGRGAPPSRAQHQLLQLTGVGRNQRPADVALGNALPSSAVSGGITLPGTCPASSG
ncbi:hypothetical protein SKAU_G00192400 [Synaphobranchus kaupii]|uniref:Uncharacterized protein n=1 Tax=Synaphobranchus kaupii TaxID=118154 RepID=A0A9Q1FDT0_SYNKA|nr:hypothetical protein SKAU_G00192400 [Synaphobranchus kaupii]